MDLGSNRTLRDWDPVSALQDSGTSLLRGLRGEREAPIEPAESPSGGGTWEDPGLGYRRFLRNRRDPRVGGRPKRGVPKWRPLERGLERGLELGCPRLGRLERGPSLGSSGGRGPLGRGPKTRWNRAPFGQDRRLRAPRREGLDRVALGFGRLDRRPVLGSSGGRGPLEERAEDSMESRALRTRPDRTLESGTGSG